MSNRRVQRRLKRALEEQKMLEEELEKLQGAEDASNVCKEVIKHVQAREGDALMVDPMANPENPWHVNTCFVAGTQVQVSSGGKTVAIEELRVGDKVVTVRPTGAGRQEHVGHPIEELPAHLEEGIVTDIYRIIKNTTTQIRFRAHDDATMLECTDNHPIYVYEEGWKTVSGRYDKTHGFDFDVGKLQVGDQVCLASGELAEIESLITVDHPEGVAVYNLSVSDGRTYFANGVLTHNKCACVIL